MKKILMMILLILVMLSTTSCEEFFEVYLLHATTESYSDSLPLNSKVLRFKSNIKEEMKKQGVPYKYLPILLAICQQESGGRAEDSDVHGDIFQSGESINKRITSPGESITAGVSYFKQLLARAKELGIESDMKAIIQSYNYGIGFLDFAKSKGGYSLANAEYFSLKMQKEFGQSIYGDPEYVNHVSRYYNSSVALNNKLIFPIRADRKSTLTYGFGSRIHPMRNTIDFHDGMDFLNDLNTPLVACVSGKVESDYNNSMGNYIIISDDNKQYIYMHLNKRVAETGDFVSSGQLIGYMGTTGTSNAVHLHFQIEVDGTPVNPEEYLDSSNWIDVR